MAYNLFVVSHTHWDREWYQPFEEFRIRLVRLMDKLLSIMANDPDYRYFTLDGQTIVLEDYLQIRPEKEEEVRRLVQQGRLLIGPWWILPDEFLVSPEATIRNLMLGDRIAQRFGAKMEVGYLPDPFGHIGQMPQILTGFGMDVAVLRRGLSDEPTELIWQAPDGSSVLLIYLRDGYDNAAHLPLNDDTAFREAILRARDSLAPHGTTSNILLMNGTDHMEPQPELPAAMARANQQLEDVLIHSTLPMFVQAIRQANPKLQTVRGELRSPKRHHLIPGVLSTRMRIKQRNTHCQTLLEKWAEPFSAWAQLLPDKTPPGDRPPEAFDPKPLIHQAWRYLMQNHPHDSICGCSVDQVHKEMDVRFDWVEQIGEEVTRQSLTTIASHINTAGLEQEGQMGLVVFNPVTGPRTDIVTAKVQVPGSLEDFALVDEGGHEIPCQVLKCHSTEFASLDLDRGGLTSMMGLAEGGRILGMAIQEVHIQAEEKAASIDITLTEHGQPRLALWERSMQEVQALLADETIHHYKVRVHLATTVEFCFVAEDVPGHGYKTYLIKSKIPSSKAKAQASNLKRQIPNIQYQACIENEFFLVEADPTDGTLSITDKTMGFALKGLNRFVDGGDRGDEYNYCQPEDDLIINNPAAAPTINLIEVGPARQMLEIGMIYRLPASLAKGRSTRSKETVEVPIKTRISLYPGVRRIDFTTTVENRACDHRLRVHFPVPIHTNCSHAEGHFDVVKRSLDLPQDTADWIEQPVPTHPQRTFVDVNDGEIGLLVINKGLPEYEVLRAAGGAEVALTLLRCVGWLSRDDLHSRRGHAGPAIETPGAQCLGKHTFEYALVPHSGSWEAGFAHAHAFNAPLRAIATGVHTGKLPPRLSFVQLEPPSLVISAIKQAESGEGLIVRFYNIADEEVTGRLKLYRPFAKAALVNLNEEEIEELPSNERGEIELPVRGKQVVTAKFEFS